MNPTTKTQQPATSLSRDAKVYIAGHRGLVGGAIRRAFERHGYTNLIGRAHQQLDLTN